MGSYECVAQYRNLSRGHGRHIQTKNMRNLLTLLFLASTGVATAQQQPKLIVGVVVDQMRTDYIYRYWDKFGDNGFKKLCTNGYFARNAHFDYIPTFTGPGHASVYTGATPMVHGIIANNWFDRASSSEVYCVDDAKTTIVGSDETKMGASPARCLAPGLGDAVRIATGFKGKSIGLSIKDRSAVLPAGHAANGAFWFDKKSGKTISSTYYGAELPAWVQEFNKAKHADKLSADGWNPMLAIGLYDESTADNTPYEKSFVKGAEPVFPYDVAKAIKSQGYDAFTYTPFANTYLVRLAEAALIGEQLGQDEHTDLLSISFSAPDIIGHNYGPQSIEIEDTYLRLDQDLAQLLAELDLRVGAGNYVLFLTADHAAAQVPQYLIDHHIPAGYFDDEAFSQNLKAFLGQRFGNEALLHHYSNQQVFINHQVAKSASQSVEVVAQEVRRWALEQGGVADALLADHLRQPLPTNRWAVMAANGWNAQRSGDVLVQYLPGYIEWHNKGTTHGSSYNYDSHVPVVFYGAGVPVGESAAPVRITQIVATVCHLARIALPDAAEHEPIF